MGRDELLLRRQRLLARSAELRLALAQQSQVFKKPLAAADQGREVLRWLANKPAWPIGAVLLVTLLRPRRAVIWGERLWWAWRGYQQARAWIRKP